MILTLVTAPPRHTQFLASVTVPQVQLPHPWDSSPVSPLPSSPYPTPL